MGFGPLITSCLDKKKNQEQFLVGYKGILDQDRQGDVDLDLLYPMSNNNKNHSDVLETISNNTILNTPNQPLCDYEQNRAYLVSVLETFTSVFLRSRKILSKFGLLKVMLLKIILCTSCQC